MLKKSPNRTSGKRAKTAQPAQIYELKITLQDSKPPIWRRIAVAADMRLSDLHGVIQIVMGWTNSHLHQFIVRNHRSKPTREEIQEISRNEQWDKLAECMHRDLYLSDPQFDMEEAEDESKVKLCELAPAVKSKFIYEYDFGDGWDHQIEVVKISLPDKDIEYPVCLKGKLACPPEDCGGIWGYYDMLDVLKDPKHEGYEELTEWLENDFDPELFDIERVNAALTKLR